MIVRLAGEEIHLLPQKAFYWPAKKLLGFSDVHLGKAESLQAHGIPIPSGNHVDELSKIFKLIEETSAEKVIILGDLIHHRTSWTEKLTCDLMAFFASNSQIEWTLLIGNHERGSLDHFKKFPLHLVENHLLLPPFLMTHGHSEQKKNNGEFEIQGHAHPVIKLEQGSTRLRLPCFVVSEHCMTLPSFGDLTGGYEVRPKSKQKIYAVTEKSVFQV